MKKYDDGTIVSYSSSRALAQLHSGVLGIRVKEANLTPGAGLFGAESARCDPYVTVQVNGAVAQTKTLKNTLSPQFDAQLVMYAGMFCRFSFFLFPFPNILAPQFDAQLKMCRHVSVHFSFFFPCRNCISRSVFTLA